MLTYYCTGHISDCSKNRGTELGDSSRLSETACGVGVVTPTGLKLRHIFALTYLFMASNGTTDKTPVTPVKGVNLSTPAPVDSPIPDSTAPPAAFLAYVKTLELHDLIAACEHLLAPPVRLPTINRYDVDAVEAWIDRMHVLVVC